MCTPVAQAHRRHQTPQDSARLPCGTMGKTPPGRIPQHPGEARSHGWLAPADRASSLPLITPVLRESPVSRTAWSRRRRDPLDDARFSLAARSHRSLVLFSRVTRSVGTSQTLAPALSLSTFVWRPIGAEPRGASANDRSAGGSRGEVLTGNGLTGNGLTDAGSRAPSQLGERGPWRPPEQWPQVEHWPRPSPITTTASHPPRPASPEAPRPGS
jgi:hypothetical protein